MNKISVVALNLVIVFIIGGSICAFGESPQDKYLPGGLLLDDTVFCAGIVTVGTEIYYAGTVGRVFYMQNSEFVPCSGVYAYGNRDSIPALVPGDSVCFEALYCENTWPYEDPPFYRIFPETFQLVSSGNPIPEPVLITGEYLDSTGNADSLAAPYLFCRARINDVTVDSVVAYTTSSTWVCHDPSGHSFSVREASDSINYLPHTGIRFDYIQGVIYYRYDTFYLQPAYMSDLSFADPSTNFWIEPENPEVGDSVCLYCLVTEDFNIVNVYLGHRIFPEPFERDTMTQINGTLYLHVFPPAYTAARADFWLELEDDEGNIRNYPLDAPYNYYSFFWYEIAGVSDEPSSLPQTTELLQNYPNPFNATTTLEFTIAEPGRISLKIYDLLGREIRTLAEGYYEPGNYAIKVEASHLTSGYYFLRLCTANSSQSKRLLLLK